MTLTTQHTAHILLVEDDISLADWIKEYLEMKHYQVTVQERGDLAVQIIQEQNPDLVILDGMLPGLDGIDVLKAVRPAFANTIIMVTARDEELDEVLGLEMGADDYLTKPLRANVLSTKIRKHLERQTIMKRSQDIESEVGRSSDSFQYGDFSIDKQARSVELNNKIVDISSNEFDLLWLLAERAGNTVTRDELIQALRGFDYDGFDRTVDLIVSKLRKKLNDNPSKPYRIKTVWGKGYLLVKSAW
ncbi:winged helix-turn-helix domain-containing protein [Pseudoalteromonas tunicata]|jgi:DNA-binding response OmpR family regulator|uniref:Transcriptional regulatory protein RstA n=1 Tax=Pseudoalteromonas tunicata D2 TaxID=87626 RepID=A4CEI9_9GAMM|nr:winged helix-turn-helix domain-containing protein [Pseudoalteromonas tunicata]ATC95982.1 two-component system, OmpR family, response regulator [Pseudoalteromonas tunicata]AXT31516.1 DNA-binding response regulator [Pseudoalteromonas tunicata]EAR26718.1 transcriptional regulatory protein RstA [Pseudoalteromonas tunicata D2]MDP4983839.1 winged helix-turn-helix domain-containing protein [Pseudoalteromonas tunicata]MDP5213359.1 winged helix-turn-helix domain-containing protein [Pseudoalteromonas